MRILHLINSISRSSGGPSRSSQGLVAGLRAAEVDAWLMTLNHGEEPWIKGCDQFVNGGAFEDALMKVKPDIVHLHGIWDVGLHRCAKICRAKKIPYAIAPRGMLEPWSLKQKWLKKCVARFLYQDRDLKKAAALYATADSEAEQFRKLGFKNYCIVSPNGVNLPERKVKKVGRGGQRRALFVSRMHAKKGVLKLVESWARVFRNEKREVSNEKWQCELVYTLNGEMEQEYEQRVKQRILDLDLFYQDKEGTFHSSTSTFNFNSPKSNIRTFKHSNISLPDFIFTGPLDDDAKWDAYGRADLFVLPTYSENFGIVIAEALWAGVPVITTKGMPWEDLETHHCGWWTDVSADGIEKALREAMSLSEDARTEMGQRGHKLVEDKYTWSAVVKAMVKGYEDILNGKP